MRTIAIVLGWKVMLLGIFFLLFLRIPLDLRYPHYLWVPEGSTRFRELERAKDRFLDRLSPCDGQFYLKVSTQGYSFDGDQAFFPLFPLLVSAARLLGIEPIPTGLVLNFILSAAGLILLGSLIEEHLGRSALPSILLMLSFPTAGFYNLFYTESLFLFLSVACLHQILKGKYIQAAALGLLAGLSRPQGIILFVPIFVQAIHSGPDKTWTKLMKATASLGPPAGAAAFLIYVHLHTGSPFSIFHAQEAWGRGVGPAALVKLFTPGPSRFPTDVAAATLGLATIPILFRLLPRSLAVYGAVYAVFPLLTGSFLSYFRFLSVSFSLFVAISFLLERRPCLWLIVFLTFLGCQSWINRCLLAWIFLA